MKSNFLMRMLFTGVVALLIEARLNASICQPSPEGSMGSPARIFVGDSKTVELLSEETYDEEGELQEERGVYYFWFAAQRNQAFTICVTSEIDVEMSVSDYDWWKGLRHADVPEIEICYDWGLDTGIARSYGYLSEYSWDESHGDKAEFCVCLTGEPGDQVTIRLSAGYESGDAVQSEEKTLFVGGVEQVWNGCLSEEGRAAFRMFLREGEKYKFWTTQGTGDRPLSVGSGTSFTVDDGNQGCDILAYGTGFSEVEVLGTPGALYDLHYVRMPFSPDDDEEPSSFVPIGSRVSLIPDVETQDDDGGLSGKKLFRVESKGGRLLAETDSATEGLQMRVYDPGGNVVVQGKKLGTSAKDVSAVFDTSAGGAYYIYIYVEGEGTLSGAEAVGLTVYELGDGNRSESVPIVVDTRDETRESSGIEQLHYAVEWCERENGKVVEIRDNGTTIFREEGSGVFAWRVTGEVGDEHELQLLTFDADANLVDTQKAIFRTEGGRVSFSLRYEQGEEFPIVEMLPSITGDRVVYTLDGTEPLESSSVYTEPLVIRGACVIKARSISASGVVGTVFERVVSFDAIVIPEGVAVLTREIVGESAGQFDLVVPEGVQEITADAFAGCGRVTSITLPNSVTAIAEGAFSACQNVIGITTPFVGANRDDYAPIGFFFSPCGVPDTLGSVTINDQPFISSWIFGEASALHDVTFGDGVEGLSERMFDDCPSLQRVCISRSVNAIGDTAIGDPEGNNAILGAVNLQEFLVEEDSAYYSAVNGVLYNKERTVLVCVPAAMRSIVVPGTVERVAPQAFCGCRDYAVVFEGPEPENLPQAVEHASKVFYPREFADDYAVIVSEVKFGGYTHTETVEINGVVYSYTRTADGVELISVASANLGSMEHCIIPSALNGLPVVSIGKKAFENCMGLKTVTMPAGVLALCENAFAGCEGLSGVEFEGAPPAGIELSGLTDVAILYNFEYGRDWIARGFGGCNAAPYRVRSGDGQVMEERVPSSVCLSVTNVVVQYVLNSIQPEFAIPATSDTGFVNIITEVKGGCVAVPATWANEYPSFVSKYGSDFTKALAMKTGKRDGAGNEMLVWQDYVAGTDPTDENDVFRASIAIVDGKVIISYTPELDAERKAMRKYTIWGKTSLMDANWTEVPEGDEDKYNFFKVSVEML